MSDSNKITRLQRFERAKKVAMDEAINRPVVKFYQEVAWIKITDRLPPDGQLCWITDGENTVSGCFQKFCPKYSTVLDDRVTYFVGFCLDAQNGHYLPVESVTHWMKYYTPKPPTE